MIVGHATTDLPRIELTYDPATDEITAVGVHGLIMGAPRTFAERTRCCNGNAGESRSWFRHATRSNSKRCEYCIVACGYRVYKSACRQKWRRRAVANAFGIDLRNRIRRSGLACPCSCNRGNGRKYNVAIIPDNNCVVNSGLNSVRGGTMGLTVYRKRVPDFGTSAASAVLAHGEQEASSWTTQSRLSHASPISSWQKTGPTRSALEFSDHRRSRRRLRVHLVDREVLLSTRQDTMATVHDRPTCSVNRWLRATWEFLSSTLLTRTARSPTLSSSLRCRSDIPTRKII